jgi:hypothetical protein
MIQEWGVGTFFVICVALPQCADKLPGRRLTGRSVVNWGIAFFSCFVSALLNFVVRVEKRRIQIRERDRSSLYLAS